jgi:hypothetical protein
LEFEPEPGLTDRGDLETDLTALLASLGTAAAKRDAAVVFFIDELQYVREEELAALIGALHSASQDQLPITMMAAGLPQLVGQAGRAKSYAERLFEIVPMDRLDPMRPRPRSACQRRSRMSLLTTPRYRRSSRKHWDIRIFCRNGASTAGTWPTGRR